MTIEKFLTDFWRYYLIIEEKFAQSIRYVELSRENYSTYSIEFVNQLQSIGSEIDVIMKSMSGFCSSDSKTIKDYYVKILHDYPDIRNWEVKAKDISVKPFALWDASKPGKSLTWWKAYNKIKHGRNGNYKKANLKNVLHALMALYLLEKLYFKKLAYEEGMPDALKKDSELFSISGWKSNSCYGSELLVSICDDGALDLDGGKA